MPIPDTPEEILLQTIEEFQKTVSSKHPMGNRAEAARAMGVPVTTLKARLQVAAKRGLISPLKPSPEGFEVKRASISFNKDGTIDKRHIKYGPESGGQFEVPEGHVVKGVSALLDSQGDLTAQWIKTREETALDLTEIIRNAFDGFDARADITEEPAHCEKDLITIYPICDHHFGLLSWDRETRGGNYDLKIARKRLLDCTGRLVSMSPASETAVILNLGDLLHVDDSKNETPESRNRLDPDSRFNKIVRVGVDAMRALVHTALQKHCYVRVVCLPGNHDPHSSLALRLAMEAYFESEPRVEVAQEEGDFWFHRFGKNLFGGNHGHRMKREIAASTMADLNPVDWGKSKWRYFFFAHVHKDRVNDIGSVRCESFRTLASRDAYAASMGFTTPRSATSLTFHREDGELGRCRVNV